MRTGFIGLGNMGAPMAANLVANGHEVLGFDVAGVRVEGVENVGEAAAAARDVDAVVTMLPDGLALESVYAEIVPQARAGALLLDCSTVDVESAAAAHRRAAAADLLSLDAPVSGGVRGAVAGTLTFMVGGAAEAFERAGPLLESMGGRIVHCGGEGAGQAAKLCNNMLLGISMLGTCEAFALGEKLGLEPERLFEVLSTSSGSCWSVNTYCPVPGVGPPSPADEGYAPGFAAGLMLKDLRLGQSAAGRVDADTPMGRKASALYARLVEREGADRDFSCVLPLLLAGSRGALEG